MGVVRSIARSDHWRWVSIPRWARLSSKVVSRLQRFIHVRTISSAACVWFVENSALGGALALGATGENPANGQRGTACAIPQSSPGADLQGAFSLPIPLQGQGLPRRVRVGQDLFGGGEGQPPEDGPSCARRVRGVVHAGPHPDETE